MKFKYLETIQQGSPIVTIENNITTISLHSNIKFEIVETGTTIPDEYKTIERSIPLFQIETDSISAAKAALESNGLEWMQTTFGTENII